MVFDTILVANRGEIAARVIRAARDLGLRTVAVFTSADAASPHLQLADHSIWIGEGPVADSYLCARKILDAAKRANAGAIHPGYGFLSENAEFAEAVAKAGLTFIGPGPEAIRAMGNKAEAKRLMRAAGVPCVPGYEGGDQSDAAFAKAAEGIGYPLMIKAAAGGGGRGMRLVNAPVELENALARARSEAANAFGSQELILEKAIIAPRHVEFQIFADGDGNVIHLGERDCSIQRRHQKIIEEAPCPVMTPDLRDRMGAAAVEAARAVDYLSAGTVEFLLDAEGEFHFLEMNTRLQVEHPVTEMITGLDLVAMQITVAQGVPLEMGQSDVTLNGHAIEARLYAEDPGNGFLPATGPVHLWRPASGPGIRVDAGIAQGQSITPHYDPLLAKIVAHGPTREVARARLIRALQDTVLLGTVTNAGLLTDILSEPDFVQGKATTAFLNGSTVAQNSAPQASGQIALAVALLLEDARALALARAGFVAPDQLGWSNTRIPPRKLSALLSGALVEFSVTSNPGGWRIAVDGQTFDVEMECNGPEVVARINDDQIRAVAHVADGEVMLAMGGDRLTLRLQRAGHTEEEGSDGGGITAPMPGLVQILSVSAGAKVRKGQTLAVLEAMKMQQQILAPQDGCVVRVHIVAGQQVSAGDLMFEIEEEK